MSPLVECLREGSSFRTNEVVWGSLDPLNATVEFGPQGDCTVVFGEKATVVNVFYDLLSKVQPSRNFEDSALEKQLEMLLSDSYDGEGMGQDEKLMIYFSPGEVSLRLPGHVLYFADQAVLNNLVMLMAPKVAVGDFPTHTPWGVKTVTPERIKTRMGFVIERLQPEPGREPHGD